MDNLYYKKVVIIQKYLKNEPIIPNSSDLDKKIKYIYRNLF